MTADRSDRMPRVNPPVYFLAALLMIVFLDRRLPIREILPGLVSFVGLIPLVLGFAIGGPAGARFRRAGTPFRPGSEATALVQEGPFRFTRNPMYLGMTLLLFGIALLTGSLSPLLVPPLFMALIDILFVRKEERWMEEAFGESYRAYRGRVRRWL